MSFSNSDWLQVSISKINEIGSLPLWGRLTYQASRKRESLRGIDRNRFKELQQEASSREKITAEIWLMRKKVSAKWENEVFPGEVTGEKCLRMSSDVNHVVDFRQSHWLRGKIPAKHCQDERRNGRSFFLSVVVLLFCCHCERSKIILVEIFSDMCCLVDNASWNCQTNTLARSIYPRSALQSLDERRGHAKKVGNFLLLCFSASFVQLGSSGRKIRGLCFGIWISVYWVARKRQFCKTRKPFLCYKSTILWDPGADKGGEGKSKRYGSGVINLCSIPLSKDAIWGLVRQHWGHKIH